MNRPLARLAPLVLVAPAAAQELAARYDFDETAGPGFADTSGHAQDGTWLGAPVLDQPGAHPATGRSVQLARATGDRGRVVMPAQLAPLDGDLAVVAWVHPDDTTALQRVFGNDGSWSFGVLSGGSLRFTTRGIRDYDLPANVLPGEWTHLAAVLDASYDVHFYVDGAHAGSVGGSSPANPALADWWVGCLRPGVEQWEGRIDDVQVYDGALDAAQVQRLFSNPGTTLDDVGDVFCDGVPNSTGVGAWLRATGSVVAADDDVTLRAGDLPDASFGVFLASLQSGTVVGPGGSQGTLCLAGAIGTYDQDVRLALGGAPVELVLDLNAAPAGSGQTSMTAGQTWYFQYWYRDFGPTTNFSDGLELAFQ